MKKFKLIIIKEGLNITAVAADVIKGKMDFYKVNKETKMFDSIEYDNSNKESIAKIFILVSRILDAEKDLMNENPHLEEVISTFGGRLIDISSEPDIIAAPFPLYDIENKEISSFSSIHELDSVNVLKGIRDTLKMKADAIRADMREKDEDVKPEDNSIDAMNKELEEYDHNCEDMSSLGIPAIALSGNKTICDEINRIKSMKNRTSKRKYIRKQTKEGVEPLLFN